MHHHFLGKTFSSRHTKPVPKPVCGFAAFIQTLASICFNTTFGHFWYFQKQESQLSLTNKNCVILVSVRVNYIFNMLQAEVDEVMAKLPRYRDHRSSYVWKAFFPLLWWREFSLRCVFFIQMNTTTNTTFTDPIFCYVLNIHTSKYKYPCQVSTVKPWEYR